MKEFQKEKQAGGRNKKEGEKEIERQMEEGRKREKERKIGRLKNGERVEN